MKSAASVQWPLSLRNLIHQSQRQSCGGQQKDAPGWLGGWRRGCAACLLCAGATIASLGQTFTTLVNFDGTNGDNPQFMSFVQGTDGNLYGTTSGGGTDNNGTVFKMTPAGKLTTLHSFCYGTGCTDGYNPYGSVVQGADGNFYGTTSGGGAFSCGTVFKITPAGKLTTIHNFDLYTDGCEPGGALTQAGGVFYGTTVVGGAPTASCPSTCGTIFKMTAAGKLTTLYTFCSLAGCADGSNPSYGLVLATDGNFYGTSGGGAGSCYPVGYCGTVFKITPAGLLTTLHTFVSVEGGNPSPLIQATDGNFYGTTGFGGFTGGSCTYGCGSFSKLLRRDL